MRKRLLPARDLRAEQPPQRKQVAFSGASALDGATRVYSNPVPITYGPRVIEYDLDGAGNRDAVETGPGALEYDLDATTPDPADAQMNQYTLTPLDEDPRKEGLPAAIPWASGATR